MRRRGARKQVRPDRPRLYPDDYKEALLTLRGPFHKRKVTEATVAKSLGITPNYYYIVRKKSRDQPEEYERLSFPDLLAEELFAHLLDTLEICVQGLADLAPYMEDKNISAEQLERLNKAIAELLEEGKEYGGKTDVKTREGASGPI